MMAQQELEKYLWGAATALRGTIDAGDYKHNTSSPYYSSNAFQVCGMKSLLMPWLKVMAIWNMPAVLKTITFRCLKELIGEMCVKSLLMSVWQFRKRCERLSKLILKPSMVFLVMGFYPIHGRPKNA